MFKISCVVDAGIGCYGNDDSAMVLRHIITEGFYEETADIALAVVCDGVGGEDFGYEATEIAVNHFSKLLDQDVTVESIRIGIADANSLILQAQKKDFAHRKMAATIAGIYLNKNDCIVFNVGDSKVIRYRPPYIAQLSTDHTLIEELKNLGIAPKPGQEHVITRCLGSNNAEPEILDGKDKALDCDVYIVCSDGISDVISDAEFECIMAEDISDKELCWKLIEVAISKGSNDNMSVIIIRRS